VMVGRFIPIVRILASVVAGISNMPFARFSVYNAIAGIIWSVLFGVLGFEFAHDLPRLKDRVGDVGLVALIAFCVVVVAVLVWRHLRGRSRPAPTAQN
jgi:membrane-associated protein